MRRFISCSQSYKLTMRNREKNRPIPKKLIYFKKNRKICRLFIALLNLCQILLIECLNLIIC